MARALWMITGEPDGLLPPLLEAVTSRPLGGDAPWSRGQLGSVEALGFLRAPEAVPALEEIARGPARVTDGDAFLDQRYQHAAEQALTRIRNGR